MTMKHGVLFPSGTAIILSASIHENVVSHITYLYFILLYIQIYYSKGNEI